jgi:predicted MFS family arabinose efflux permease
MLRGMLPASTATDGRAQGRLSPLRSFKHRDYALLWAGMFMGSALMPMQFVTQVLFLSEHTGDSARLVLAGLLGALRGGAMLAFSLFGGVLADRFDRRRLLMLSQSLGMGVSAVIAVVLLMRPGGDGLTLALFMMLVFAASGLSAVDAPTRQAMVPELVGREDLPNAIALDAVAMQLAFPIGLPLTGVMIDLIGYGWTYAMTLWAYASIIGALALMQYRPRDRAATAHGRQSVMGDLRYGVRFARGQRALMWIMLTTFSIQGLALPVVANLGPVWTNRVLGLSPTGVGMLAMTWGIGAMVGSLVMTNVGHFPAKGLLLAGAGAGFALCTVGFGYSRIIPLSAVLNLGLGSLLTVSSVSAISLAQRLIPNEVQGRVLSIFMMSAGISQLLTLPIGGLAQWATFELTMPLMGWTSLALVLLIVTTQRPLREAGRMPEAVEAVPVAV